LPAVIALVIVNMALGVITRAAPQLNLFGIGFTITMLFGFFVLIVGLDGVMAGISSLIDTALAAVIDLVGGVPPSGSPPGAPTAGAH
jgi:flagellar biosynthesis protein FliR